MIIKIQSADGGWFFFDGAAEVHSCTKKDIGAEVKGAGVPRNKIASTEDDPDLVRGSFLCDDQSGVEGGGWFCSFRRGEQMFELYGDTVTYLLNDNGKTIERLY